MSIQQTGKTLSLTIPAIPQLAPYIPSLSQPVRIDLPLETLKTSLRFVVIVLTYLLFRPHLEKLFRTMTGRPNPEEKDIQERMDLLKQQQQGGGKKVYAVATPGGQSPGADSTKPGSASSKGTPTSGKSRRRKA